MKDFLKSFFLIPLSLLWEKVYKIRRFFYLYGFFKTHEFSFPVFSVGNITFGGTGKTPFTIWLTKFVEERSLTPVIVTRGYKGEKEHSFGILKANQFFSANPVEFGDEPVLIARRLKKGGVVVGKKRLDNLSYYLQDLKPDIAILDDGHQHLKIERDLNFVLFDSLLPISQYEVAPRGYLREGKSALKDADIVIISRVDQAPKSKLSELKSLISEFIPSTTPIAEIVYEPLGLFNANYEKVFEIDHLKDRDVIVVAAVANPVSFFKSIEELGGRIVDQFVFDDHHYFSLTEMEKLLEKSRETNAMILTSEKDIVKMRKISIEIDVYYLEIAVKFISGQNLVENRIEQHLN